MQHDISSKMAHGKFDLPWMTLVGKYLYRRNYRDYNTTKKSLKASDWKSSAGLGGHCKTTLNEPIGTM